MEAAREAPAARHPFDEPFRLVRGLAGEIEELRAALKAEQDTRAREIKTIAHDVRELQRGLAQSRAETAELSSRADATVRTELARIDAAVRTSHDKLSSAMQCSARALQAEVAQANTSTSRLKEAVDAVERSLRETASAVAEQAAGSARGEQNLAKMLEERFAESWREMSSMRSDLLERVASLQQLDGSVLAVVKGLAEVRVQTATEVDELRVHWRAEVARLEKVVEEHRVASAAAIQRHWKTTTTDLAELRARLGPLPPAAREDATGSPAPRAVGVAAIPFQPRLCRPGPFEATAAFLPKLGT